MNCEKCKWCDRALKAEGRVKELEEENKQLHDVNDLRVKHMECGDGLLSLTLQDPTGLLQEFTSYMVKTFEDVGGTNYVEWTVTHQETGKTYSLMMQRRDGKTPAEINVELKTRVKELEDGIRAH